MIELSEPSVATTSCINLAQKLKLFQMRRCRPQAGHTRKCKCNVNFFGLFGYCFLYTLRNPHVKDYDAGNVIWSQKRMQVHVLIFIFALITIKLLKKKKLFFVIDPMMKAQKSVESTLALTLWICLGKTLRGVNDTTTKKIAKLRAKSAIVTEN